MDQTIFISDGRSKIRDALVDAASYLGLKHNGWHDIGMVTALFRTLKIHTEFIQPPTSSQQLINTLLHIISITSTASSRLVNVIQCAPLLSIGCNKN